MRRKRHQCVLFLTLLAAPATWPMASRAQQPGEPAGGKKVALCIGVNQYQSEMGIGRNAELMFAERDAAALAETFIHVGFTPEHVVVMTTSAAAADHRPSAENIRKALNALLAEVDDGDCVVVTFSGYEFQFADDDEYYLCPSDSDKADKRSLVPLSEICHALSQSKGSGKAVVIDASRTQEGNKPGAAPTPKAPPKDVAVLFACSAGQDAWEDVGRKSGRLTYYFCQGLRGAADDDKDRFVSWPELMTYLKRQLGDDARIPPEQRQIPELFGETGWLAAKVANRGFQPSKETIDPVIQVLALNEQTKQLSASGRYDEATEVARKMVSIAESIGDEKPEYVAQSVNRLALLYATLGRYAESESLYKRALDICEKVFGRSHVNSGRVLNDFALLYAAQGRYMDAEPLHRRAVSIHEEAFGKNHPDVATCLNNLANVYKNQDRSREAEAMYVRALAIREKELEASHPDIADSLVSLAVLLAQQERYSEAEPMFVRARGIYEDSYGEEHFHVATILLSQANVCLSQRRFAEAEPIYLQALEIRQQLHNNGHHDSGSSEQLALGFLYDAVGNLDEADRRLSYAIMSLKSSGAEPFRRYTAYKLRAQVKWKYGQFAQFGAMADLADALNCAEQQRMLASGAERERAEYFASFARGFELMVEWQTEWEFGSVGQAFEAIERSRARSLQDQLNTSGGDLLAGLPADEAMRLRQPENAALAKVAGLETNLRALVAKTDYTVNQKDAERKKLVIELNRAREEYAKAYADIRAASPAYRLAVGQDQKPISLEALQAWVARRNGLLLEYLIGEEGAFLLVVPAQGNPRIEKLALSEEQTKTFGATAGPLTGKRLHDVLVNQEKTGVLQLLKNENESGAASKKLAALWTALIPEAERAALREGKYQKLFIVPDGELAAFPFETLVFDPIGEPEYLIDFGPPIIYAPTATIFFNLEQRKKTASSKQEPILSVGVASYSVNASANDEGALAMLTPQAKVRRAGIELIDLPGAATECDWVRQNFQQEGVASSVLFNADANEVNIRRELRGRRLAHFACHGLVDESPGNLFGALALAPSKSDDPANDGFLTLAEIYGMNLAGCELTLLSACETNLGPLQKGEGSLALSRGFLVAGSRRVIASNWLVSDEAAPTLVSYLTALIAQAEKEVRQPDYAVALQEAKRAVRQQPKWKDPFYWAPMVLVGPN